MNGLLVEERNCEYSPSLNTRGHGDGEVRIVAVDGTSCAVLSNRLARLTSLRASVLP